MPLIYTIGHSTLSIEQFVARLHPFAIRQLVDIRHFPGSRKYPHFNKEALEAYLKNEGLRYTHLVQLGGRRKALPNTRNTLWRHEAFRGYADYMETGDFKEGMQILMEMGNREPTAYMCSEALWWRCHRAMVSDVLKAKGWQVLHIMGEGKAQEHPYTAPALIVGDKVIYYETNQTT